MNAFLHVFPPDREIVVRPFTVSGPGGSGKDTSKTGAKARWKIRGLTPAQRERLKQLYPKSVTEAGDLLAVATETRSFVRNAAIARETIRRKVRHAIREAKPRLTTEPPRAAKEKRREEKRRRSDVKKLRGRIRD